MQTYLCNPIAARIFLQNKTRHINVPSLCSSNTKNLSSISLKFENHYSQESCEECRDAERPDEMSERNRGKLFMDMLLLAEFRRALRGDPIPNSFFFSTKVDLENIKKNKTRCNWKIFNFINNNDDVYKMTIWKCLQAIHFYILASDL